jgi:ketosteroid isomerase-like protein
MNTDAVRQIIAEENRRLGAAVAGKDYAGMAGFYTEDAKLLPPDAPIVLGAKGDRGVLAHRGERTRANRYRAQNHRS